MRMTDVPWFRSWHRTLTQASGSGMVLNGPCRAAARPQWAVVSVGPRPGLMAAPVTVCLSSGRAQGPIGVPTRLAPPTTSLARQWEERCPRSMRPHAPESPSSCAPGRALRPPGFGFQTRMRRGRRAAVSRLTWGTCLPCLVKTKTSPRSPRSDEQNL